jgi:transposase-like protein
MDRELRRLRAEAQRLAHGKPPSQVRYPDRFRRAAVALARMRLGPGTSVGRLAWAVGVSEPTLTKWLRRPTAPVLRPVAVTPGRRPEQAAVPRLLLITARGVRVRGLDRDTLVAVLQALG